MGKRRIFVSLLVGALALAITGGAVLAQSDDSNSNSRAGKLAERVASILGLETSQVQDAMKQAGAELREERLQEKLDAMVESERITQEQADDLKTWLEARPEGPFKFKRWLVNAEDLDALVESGKITQEQADSYAEYSEWLESRPEGIFDGSKSWGSKGRWGHHGGGYYKGFCQKDGDSSKTAVTTDQA